MCCDHRASIVGKGGGYGFDCFIAKVTKILTVKFKICDEFTYESKDAVAGLMILEFASSSLGSVLIRKSLKWLSRHLVSMKCLSSSLSPMVTIESLSVSVGGTG